MTNRELKMAKTLTRERIIWHLDTPVCEIMSGVRTHVQFLNLKEMWGLCYALKCDSPEELAVVMWKMIQKRRKTHGTACITID